MTSQYLNITKEQLARGRDRAYPDIVSIANTILNQTGQAIEGHRDDHGRSTSPSACRSSMFMNWYKTGASR